MIIPVAFIVGVAIGIIVGWILGNECGRANGMREERTRVAQVKRDDDMIRTVIRR